jgi:uncharacterized protein with HEPN domain
MPSDPDSVRRWLNDIRYHIAMAQTFMEGISYDALRDDLRTTYAVTRCLEIISEASRRLPDELKARHPSIAWKNMAGLATFIATTTKMWLYPSCGSCFRIIYRRYTLSLSKS